MNKLSTRSRNDDIYEITASIDNLIKNDLELENDLSFWNSEKGEHLFLEKLASGLFICGINCVFNSPIEIKRKGTMNNDYYFLYLDLSDHFTRHIIDRDALQDQAYTTYVGRDTFRSLQFFSSAISGKIQPEVGGSFLALFIILSRKWLLSNFSKTQMTAGNPVMKELLLDRSFFLQTGITNEEAGLAIDIVKGNYPDYLMKIGKKAKVLMLLSSYMNRLMSDRKLSEKAMEFSDMSRILKAKDLLIANFEERSPSIKAMAKEAAMGTTKFKRYFKRIFGMSCYQYHQKARMNFARELLDTGNFTASEVAFKVGYMNQGQFSKKFKHYYSCLPSEYRRNILVMKGMTEQYSEL